MSDETRTKILEAGAALIRRQGFNNTGLKDILDAVGVPKGSFYHYFPSKEAFGLAVVDFQMERIGAMAGQALTRPDLPPLARLRGFFTTMAAFFADQGYALGCPIGNLAQEMGDLSEAFRARLDAAFAAMTAGMARVLAEARDAGEIPPDTDVEATADFLVTAWQGALLRMKVAKDGRPLATFDRLVFGRLLPGRS